MVIHNFYYICEQRNPKSLKSRTKTNLLIMKKLTSLKNGKVLTTGSLKQIQGGGGKLHLDKGFKQLPDGVCSGSGTDDDPYVLESLVIPSGASDGC